MARITIINRYFWPEVFLVNDIAIWLAEAGYEVDVITSQPSYNPEAKLEARPSREIWNGVHITRIPLLPENGRGIIRQLNNLLFIFFSASAVLFGRSRNAVWTASFPPVLQPFLLQIATKLRSAKLIYFVQDIYPEIGVLMNMVRPGWFTRIVEVADNWTLTAADVVVTLSQDMAASIRARGVRLREIRVINNFSAVEEAADEFGINDEVCRFIFAGNIGRFQNLERLVEIFGKVDPALCRLELMGEGRVKSDLLRIVAEKQIRSVVFHSFLPATQAFHFIRSCDFGVVSLTPGIYRFAYPSKTFTYLAAGLPLLGLIESNSEFAREVRDREIGSTIDWSADDATLVAAIEGAARLRHSLRKNVKLRAQDLFDRSVARKRWLDLFVEVMSQRSTNFPSAR